jgi:lysophospholipase
MLHPAARGTVVLTPGIIEFSEKYFETARDLFHRGFNVFFMNWFYQGRSGRFSPNPQKRHSDGFDADIADLDAYIHQIVKAASPDRPLILLAHSTGGNIGLRYCLDHPGVFRAAAFSAPLLGVHGLGWLPLRVWHWISGLLSPFHTAYVPGGTDWSAQTRTADKNDRFSSDPVRAAVHNAWCLQEPQVQCGSPTLGWLHHAFASMLVLHGRGAAEKITLPCMVAVAGGDVIVDTPAAVRVARRMPKARLLFLEGARHEILMERDDIRSRFLYEFDKMLEENSILG